MERLHPETSTIILFHSDVSIYSQALFIRYAPHNLPRLQGVFTSVLVLYGVLVGRVCIFHDVAIL